MIQYTRHKLSNGLRILLHPDPSTPMIVMNIMYHVGSKDEDPERTGFAHLFEHLMFGGSVNIPKYDEPLQRAGGENNAFTNSDITNYYLSLPAVNLETACWLESDRMLDLAFSAKSLDVQRQVVVEEFRQNYLNQPYGDAWLQLRPLAYKSHPYRWPTIGKEPSHIELAKMEDVREFYTRFYNPSNAIICLSGNLQEDKALHLLEKWFGSIEKAGHRPALPAIEPEPEQGEYLELVRDVPQDAIYLAYRMCGRTDPDYYASDLLSDILGYGHSSRLYRALVHERSLFSDIRAYISGEHHPGLFIVSGKLNPGVNLDEASMAVKSHLQLMTTELTGNQELQKVKNQIESSLAFSETSLLTKAINLCQAELLGDADDANKEAERYAAVSPEQIRKVAAGLFSDQKENLLVYRAAKKV
jgi:zinc protease